MTKEEKREAMLKRIKDDELRAKQLAAMKKPADKGKNFVSKKDHFDLTTNDPTGKKLQDNGRDLIKKKRQYDLSSGHAICLCKLPDKDAYYFGQSTGKILYFDPSKNKIQTIIQTDSPVLDILALSFDKLILADDFCRIKIFDHNKLVKIIPYKCSSAAGTYNYSKILVGNEQMCMFINETADAVIKVNLTDFSTSVISLNKPRLFQLSLEDDILYAVTEEGFLVKATIMDPNKMNVDELEAFPDGVDIESIQIEQLTNDQIGFGVKSHANDLLESSYMLDGERYNLENSGGEDVEEEKSGPMGKSQEGYDRMIRALNMPVKALFYRSIASSPDFVVVNAHDGQGHNIIYLYNTKLELKAFKYLRVDDHDFGFNLTKYLHKMHIEKRKEGSYLFAVTHKRNFRIFVYKLTNEEITLFRRFKNVHSGLITDLRLDLDTLATCSRDRSFNFYHLDFKVGA